MEMLTLVDRLEALVNQGWRLPFSVKTVINENAFFEIIDQMRVAIPQEVKQANDLMAERERLLAAAAEEAERTIEMAREHAARLVDEHDVITAAHAEGEGIKAQARREAAETVRGADEYALGVLSELESNLAALLQTTANGLAKLKRSRGQSASERRE
jgi:hypothetical protein